jgi:DNA-directed RNA polymerase sigma subunit (sigma70/sigma32)
MITNIWNTEIRAAQRRLLTERLGVLNGPERFVITERLGLNGKDEPAKHHELAAKLGISDTSVRRLETTAAAKLQREVSA